VRPDRSHPLLGELERLGSRELKLTLAQLSAEERAQVLGLLEAGALEAPAPAFEALVGLSPWLLKAVDETKSPGPARLTPATRSALSRALNEVAGKDAANERPKAREPNTFIGRMLARNQRRRAGS